MLPAGQREAVLVTGSSGWILSQLVGSNDLVLTEVGLSDGKTTSILVEKNTQGSAGGGLAADGIGHLWITHARDVFRVDEPGGAVQRWTLPEPPSDAAPSDENWGAGNAEAAAWDASAGLLLFVRNGDHRLYNFDPGTAAVSIAADVPITTSYISRLAVEAGGPIAVTGSRSGSSQFAPAAVRLTSGKAISAVLDGVLAVCAGPSSITELDSTGHVGVLGSGDLSPAAVAPEPPSDVPFACDPSGNSFTVTVRDGAASVVRRSSTGVIAKVQLALIQTGPIHGFGGVSPYHWLGPGLVALLPDGKGGVWLVSQIGTQTETTGFAPGYPSLWRVTFP